MRCFIIVIVVFCVVPLTGEGLDVRLSQAETQIERLEKAIDAKQESVVEAIMEEGGVTRTVKQQQAELAVMKQELQAARVQRDIIAEKALAERHGDGAVSEEEADFTALVTRLRHLHSTRAQIDQEIAELDRQRQDLALAVAVRWLADLQRDPIAIDPGDTARTAAEKRAHVEHMNSLNKTLRQVDLVLQRHRDGTLRGTPWNIVANLLVDLRKNWHIYQLKHGQTPLPDWLLADPTN